MVSGPQDLELQTVVSPRMGAKNQTPGPLEEQTALLMAEASLQPPETNLEKLKHPQLKDLPCGS